MPEICSSDSLKSLAIVSVSAIESECLFVKVSETGDNGSTDTYVPLIARLSKRPKVFNAVRVNLTVNVFLGVIDYAVNVISVRDRCTT